MKIGISGHQNIPEEATSFLVSNLRTLVRQGDPSITGLTSLAIGADQLFAQEVLDLGGSIQAIVPSAEYETTFETADTRQHYSDLLSAAATRVVLPYPRPSEEAFLAAGLVIAERSDLVVAIWDGSPSRGLGGTADIVAYARSIGKKVVVLWPEGVDRWR